MEWSWATLPLLLLAMSFNIVPSDSCSVVKWRKWTPEGMLANANIVVKGKVKELYNVTDSDGVVLGKAKFTVKCVLRMTPKDATICDEIIIDRNEMNSCQSTFLKANQEVYVALQQDKCGANVPKDCTYRIHMLNLLQSAAFPITDKLTTSLSQTCGLLNYKLAEKCGQNEVDNSCPVKKHVGECVEASSSKLTHNLFTVFIALLIICQR